MDKSNEPKQITLRADCIQLNVSAKSWMEAIEIACSPLISKGLISKDYVKDVIDRELKWSTGLPTQPTGVAIPHGERTVNINESTIGVCTLREPVKFKQAGEDDEYVDVSVIFILAIKDAVSQIGVIKNLMTVLSNAEVLTNLLNAKNQEDFIKIFSGN